MSLYKCPGAQTLLSHAVVQFGIDAMFDTLILPDRYNYRSVPLWSPVKKIADRAGCSRRTAFRWFWSHDLFRYRTDNYVRPTRRAA